MNKYNVYINDKKIEEIEAGSIKEVYLKFGYMCKPLKKDGYDVQVGDMITVRQADVELTPEEEIKGKEIEKTLKTLCELNKKCPGILDELPSEHLG